MRKNSARTVGLPVSGCRVSGTSRNRTWVHVRDRRRCVQGSGEGLPGGGRKAGERRDAERSGRAAAFRRGSAGLGHGGRSESIDSHIGVWSACGPAHPRAALVRKKAVHAAGRRRAGRAAELKSSDGNRNAAERGRKRRTRPLGPPPASKLPHSMHATPGCPGAREREARLQAQLADLQRPQYGHVSERTPPGRGSRWTGWAAAWTTRALSGCSAE